MVIDLVQMVLSLPGAKSLYILDNHCLSSYCKNNKMEKIVLFYNSVKTSAYALEF
jgi:pentatricopeptide repeat protein